LTLSLPLMLICGGSAGGLAATSVAVLSGFSAWCALS